MRAWVGLRGPVLREWSCVLELQLEADGKRLELASSGDGAYRKHFLKLDGLGVRDLLVLGDDLLILADPTMGHDGPRSIWRCKNGAKANASSASPADRVIALPQRQGNDRPEGMTLFELGGSSTSVLVVFDTPSAERLVGPATVLADIYRLP